MSREPNTGKTFGDHLANLASILSTNWLVVIGGVVAFALGAAQYAFDFVADIRFLTAAVLFAVTFWLFVGFCYLRDRRRGFPVKRSMDGPGDLAWALSAVSVWWGFSRHNDSACLQLGAQFQNASGVALKFEVEHMEVRIGTRSIKLGKQSSPHGVIPSSIIKVYRLDPFPKKEVEDFIDRSCEGTLDLSIKYGRHDGAFERRMKIEYKLFMFIAEASAGGVLSDTIVSETDGPL